MINKNRKPISPENALYRAAALCSIGEQAENDIRIKLKNWGITPNDADKIISRLLDEKYISEERYARAFCRDKFRFGGWGKVKIAFSLKQKMISQDIIANALEEISDDDYKEALLKALKAKNKTLSYKEPAQARASLCRFAASRGFEPALIFSLLPQVISNCDEID